MIREGATLHLIAIFGALFCPTGSSFAVTEKIHPLQSGAAAVLVPMNDVYRQRKSITVPMARVSWKRFSLSPLHQTKNNDDEDGVANKSQSRDPRHEQSKSFLTDRIQNADPLEIRLDATLASIYVLCRFLIYDITTGAKDHPGWEFKDVLWLLQTSSSAILLAALWTGAGLITRIFEDGSYELNILKVLGTVVLAAPIWLVLEIQFGWPPAGLLYAEGADDMIPLVLTGSVGLCSVMLLGKYLTSGWR